MQLPLPDTLDKLKLKDPRQSLYSKMTVFPRKFIFTTPSIITFHGDHRLIAANEQQQAEKFNCNVQAKEIHELILVAEDMFTPTLRNLLSAPRTKPSRNATVLAAERRGGNLCYPILSKPTLMYLSINNKICSSHLR